MRRLYIVISVLILALSINSCKNNSTLKSFTLKKHEFTIKGHYFRDSLLHDTVYYYDLHGNLVKKEYYKYGVLSGKVFEYYPGGIIKNETSFENGLKSGSNKYFNNFGKLAYSDFYFTDLPVGPITYFDDSVRPIRYFYITLENRTLIDINYRNWKGIGDIVQNFIYYTYNKQKSDTTEQNSLFIYLPSPPKLKFEYSIIEKNINTPDKEVVVRDLSAIQVPFATLTLPVLENNLKYFVRLRVYDSIIKKESIVNSEISYY